MVNVRNNLAPLLPAAMLDPVEWIVSDGFVPYADALAFMDDRVVGIADGKAPEAVWLLEHPPLYTGGTSAHDEDLRDSRFPVHRTGRGGQFTYHGPGQRVAYVMLDLHRRGPDVRRYVATLEEWMIRMLAFTFGLSVLTGIIFGIVPALRASRVDLDNGTLTNVRLTRFRCLAVHWSWPRFHSRFYC